jgi:polysaccharide biosynthesis/export protein
MVSLLLIGSPQFLTAQTPEPRSQKSQSDQGSENFKTNNNSAPGNPEYHSKAELKRRDAEAKKYYELGQKFGHANLFKQAAEVFQKSIDLKPDYADAYFGLGHAYYDLGRWEEAIRAFERVIELNPRDKEAFTRLHDAETKLRAQEGTLSRPENSSATGDRMALAVNPITNSSATAPTLTDPDGAALLALYKVGPGDVLEISLPDTPGYQATLFTVTANGLLEHPLLDQPLKVAGLTQEEITVNLGENIARGSNSGKGRVLVAVREYNSHTIMVSGLVKEPGTKTLQREAIPLYVVLADAQPLPEAGQVVIVPRAGEPVHLDLLESRSRTVLVRPGDVITVQATPMSYFYVGGEVKNPGERLFRPGLTLIQAILSAGGVTENGKRVELGRERGDGLLTTISYKLKDIHSGKLPDVPIQPGDRIVVVH